MTDVLRYPRLTATALSLLAGLALTPGFAFAQIEPPTEAAQPAEPPSPPEMTADEITQDQDMGLVTATGNVVVDYAGRRLTAETLTYDMTADRVTAKGNIVLKHADGSVTFADEIQLSGDLASGVMQNIRMLMSDRQSRVTAARAERMDGVETVMDDATYTPCKPCREDPSRAPLWQVKAKTVTHDQNEKQMVYNNAWLEFAGIPIAYTPYLSHPDPTVKRESGFLAPTWGGNNNLGATIGTPYFWVIDDNSDMTIKPTFTSDENAILGAEYRKNFVNGDMILDGSATVDNTNTFRGHFFGEGSYEFDPTWRGKLKIHRASDDTYLRRYGYGAPRFLESTGTVEGFAGRNYASAQFYSFQGQKANDDPGLTPLILPLLNYNYVSEPDKKGAFWNFDGNALSLYRSQGSDTRRLSGRLGWNMPYISKWGEVYSVKASLRADAYNVADVSLAGRTDRYAGFQGRLYPLVSMDWRYPMIKSSPDGKQQQVLEPILVGAFSPNGQNPNKIPNEDSRDFEFDDTNLFSPNRFTGLDRVESGPRAAYGLKWDYYDAKVGKTSMMIGQAYRFHKDALFVPESGLSENFSDYVGRITANPTGNLGGSYRFRLDKNTLGPRRSELDFTIGPKSLALAANYLYVNQNPAQDTTAEFGDREELTLTLSSAMTQYWTGRASVRNDLTQDGGPLTASLSAVYDDECFTFSSDLTRNYTYDRDFQSGLVMMFRLVFKTLGEVQTGSNLGAFGQ